MLREIRQCIHEKYGLSEPENKQWLLKINKKIAEIKYLIKVGR